MEFLSPGCIVADNIAVSGETILIGYQSVQSDRPPRMKFSGADADLRAEAVPVSVRKSRAAVPVDAGAVHHLLKIRRGLRVLRENGVRVMRAVPVYMLHCLPDAVDKADRNIEIIVFPREVLRLHDVVGLQRAADKIPVRHTDAALQRQHHRHDLAYRQEHDQPFCS